MIFHFSELSAHSVRPPTCITIRPLFNVQVSTWSWSITEGIHTYLRPLGSWFKLFLHIGHRTNDWGGQWKSNRSNKVRSPRSLDHWATKPTSVAASFFFPRSHFPLNCWQKATKVAAWKPAPCQNSSKFPIWGTSSANVELDLASKRKELLRTLGSSADETPISTLFFHMNKCIYINILYILYTYIYVCIYIYI